MKKQNLLRSFGAALLAVVMLLSLAACGEESTFDASGYVSAYLKATVTGETADLEGFSKEADVDVEEDYDAVIEEALGGIGGDLEFSEEVQSQFKELIQAMLGGVSYTVGEAAELTEGSASGYTVPVTVKPLKLDVADELQEWAESLDEGSFDLTNMDAVYDQLFGEVITLLKDAVAKGEYGEEITFNLTVTKNANGLYALDDSELTEMGQKLFTTDLTDMYGLS